MPKDIQLINGDISELWSCDRKRAQMAYIASSYVAKCRYMMHFMLDHVHQQ